MVDFACTPAEPQSIRTMMRQPSSLLAVGLLVAGVMASRPADAELRTLLTAGLWTAYGGTTDSQRAVCGIGTTGADGRHIAIEQASGETGIEVILEKPSWVIPDNTQIEIMFQIDSNQGPLSQAVGSGSRIVIRMPFDASIGFMRGIRYGRQIKVFFPSGNELPWTGGLKGTSAAIDAFNDCRASLAPATPTQPFRLEQEPGQTVPTQPFGTSSQRPRT